MTLLPTAPLLPTPRAVMISTSQRARDLYSSGPSLYDALLPTPKASDGPNGGPGMRNGRGAADALPAIAALLPTPVAADSNGARNATSRRRDDSRHHDGTTLGDVAHLDAFGQYADAIRRWELVLGRPAPPPTVEGRLSAPFVEFMMGLPAGWVTDTPGISRAAQLKALGNGVVPQQAAHALRLLGVAP